MSLWYWLKFWIEYCFWIERKHCHRQNVTSLSLLSLFKLLWILSKDNCYYYKITFSSLSSHPLLSIFIYFYPFPSFFIHCHQFHPLLSICIHFYLFFSTVIHFRDVYKFTLISGLPFQAAAAARCPRRLWSPRSSPPSSPRSALPFRAPSPHRPPAAGRLLLPHLGSSQFALLLPGRLLPGTISRQGSVQKLNFRPRPGVVAPSSRRVAPTSSSRGNLGDVFGNGETSVKFATPQFQFEFWSSEAVRSWTRLIHQFIISPLFAQVCWNRLMTLEIKPEYCNLFEMSWKPPKLNWILINIFTMFRFEGQKWKPFLAAPAASYLPNSTDCIGHSLCWIQNHADHFKPTKPTDFTKCQPKFHGFDQISRVRLNFTVFTKFHGFD